MASAGARQPATAAGCGAWHDASVRLLHLVGRSHGRGAELAALELARALDARGHENVVLACNPAFDHGQHPSLPTLSRRVRMGAPSLIESTFRLRRRLDRERYDVVVAHGGRAVTVAAMARRAGGPSIVWQRILGFPRGWRWAVRKPWWRAIANRTDAAVALTPQMRDELVDLGFDRPIWVIPNFRDPTRFAGLDRASESERLKRELGIERDVALIGLVGHLIEQKRPERAVEVLAHARSAGARIELVVAGDGPLREDMRTAARDRGLAAHVHVLGHRHDVERILAGLDVLILTSDDEGIPGILIEAQMAGCPVVTFPFAGAATVVADHETGIVLPAADSELMATEVLRLLADPDARRQMAARGRARGAEFSLERAAGRYEDHIGALLRAQRRAASA